METGNDNYIIMRLLYLQFINQANAPSAIDKTIGVKGFPATYFNHFSGGRRGGGVLRKTTTLNNNNNCCTDKEREEKI